jgi:membrane-associated phospholipid phosphatase
VADRSVREGERPTRTTQRVPILPYLAGDLPVARALRPALLCALTFAGLTVAFKVGAVSSVDRQTELQIHADLHGSLNGIMTALTSVGASWPMAVLALACAALCLLQSSLKLAGLVLTCPAGASVLDTAFKNLIDRQRPHLWPHAAVLNSYSFPSGHATLSAAFFAGTTYAIWKLMGPRRGQVSAIISTALIAGIGFSRIYLGVHWPSDVLAGYALGLGWALVLVIVSESLETRTGVRRAESPSADRRAPIVRDTTV